jgi:hypothetical protein
MDVFAKIVASGSFAGAARQVQLSPTGSACFRACMHRLDSSWGNFCDYSCF